MATLDWALIGVLAASALLGAWRGLVYEVLSVLGWLASFVMAQVFAPDAAQWLPVLQTAGQPLRYAAGFALVFIATAFAAGLLSWIAKKLIAAIGLRPVDRTLGAAFGLVRGVVLLLAGAVVVSMTALGTADWWQASQGARVLEVALKGVKPLVPQEFGQYLP